MADTVSSSYDLKFPMETYDTSTMASTKIKNWTLKIPNPKSNLTKNGAETTLRN